MRGPHPVIRVRSVHGPHPIIRVRSVRGPHPLIRVRSVSGPRKMNCRASCLSPELYCVQGYVDIYCWLPLLVVMGYPYA